LTSLIGRAPPGSTARQIRILSTFAISPLFRRSSKESFCSKRGLQLFTLVRRQRVISGGHLVEVSCSDEARQGGREVVVDGVAIVSASRASLRKQLLARERFVAIDER